MKLEIMEFLVGKSAKLMIKSGQYWKVVDDEDSDSLKEDDDFEKLIRMINIF
jgi:hypothetical protein